MKTIVEPSKEVLSACKAGDRAAFKTIFDLYKMYAYNLIYKITGPSSDHEDLLQETFFQVYLSLRTFEGASSFTTWFHRVVVQVCSGNLRYKLAAKRKPGEPTINFDDTQETIPDKTESRENRLALRDLVEKALAGLDDSLRIPLVLNIYSEMEIGEIAAVMNIPEGTVKSRLFTARKQMKEFIQNAG
ncbi:MAG TPA: RNA polymerase sigma factor [Chitinivibrionales bacterium]|nr:RNA polymerase sigma factor [Chitinivibrionales bacterium]